MNWKDKLNTALKAANDIVDTAKEEGRDLSPEEQTKVKAYLDEARSCREHIKAKADSDALVAQLGAAGQELVAAQESGTALFPGAGIGDHYVKHAGDSLRKARGSRFSIGAPDFDVKAAVTRGTLTDITQGPAVTLPLRRPVFADVLLSGVIGGTTLQYFVEGAVSGGITSVAENAAKPEVSGGFTAATETLTKIAGWTKESDELIEDFPALASIVNQRLLARLAIVEENQLLSGDGTAPNLRGILNRTGILTVASGTATGATAVFKAMTAIALATFNSADFVVVHPTDYERERLRTDANTQYLGGGPFMGPYGVGGVPVQPSLWGLQTIVTAAITAGTALVGTSTAAQVFRKGGVRVDTTNTDQDDFINNRMTVRVEERLLLACYYPAAFATVTMS